VSDHDGGFQPNALAQTPGELLIILMAGAAVAGALFTAGSGLTADLMGWLVEHSVLLPAARDPQFPIPLAGGAGLDGPRLMVAAGVGTMPAAWAVDELARRIVRRHRERDLV